MLTELRVENLLLIERAELRLAEGLNVLTGETGAGKTVLAHALDLLLGGKARQGIVRPGAREAYVEGVFELDDRMRAELGDLLPEGADELVLARRVSSEGRTRALICGRTATVSDLREAAAPLVAFYGQHEHRRLMLGSAQLEILDGFCGDAQRSRRARAAVAHGRVRDLERRREDLRERAGAREREIDLLEYELREIEEAAPEPAEQAALTAERDRLRHVEALRAGALGGAEAVAPEATEAGGGVAVLLADAARGLEAVEGVDARLDELLGRWRTLSLEADDLGAELRRYADELDAGEAGRLEAVEERLGVLDRLARKHGGSLEAVLAHAERCRARRDELTGAEEALGRADAELRAAREELAEHAAALHAARAKAAPKLAKAVIARLGELAMEGAEFRIELIEREPGPTGADSVEFLIAPNSGVPAAPLRESASGGEMSRVMLALMSVAHDQGAGTLVFDEIDAGIGGQTARAVGERLRELAQGRQVLCITHLPQVASLAARHFSIAKDPSGNPAVTTVSELDDGAVVGELVRMLGADEDDRAAVEHAERLRAVA
ncbi:DNA repair protein RecN [Svornostia abyssi]|uniref:DNA repair protein RecN n=1 Tax=Svornostia abyssi TaxID=2898438 RepID=A0ABY5PD62_9ACTN|nr:DNA repair protein RecN [Parviterribacteraceae bacterium J379]